jgi:predicted RNase H-like HicB family nuclease
MASYIALVRKNKDSCYGVDFPDFPGCITAGDTMDDAVRKASEVLEFHARGMREDDDIIPAPSTMETVMADPDNREDVVATLLVQLNEPSKKAVRLNITMEEDLLSRVDSFAKTHGMSRSSFLAQASLKAMSEK